MATFEINEGSKLDAETVTELQEKFAKFEAEIAEVAELEKAAISYFDKLEALGDKLEEEFSEYDGDISINGNEFYTSEYGGAVTASSLLDFWIPSSMSC